MKKASNHFGRVTIHSTPVACKSGHPVRFSDVLAGIPEANALVGDDVAIVTTGIDIDVEVVGGDVARFAAVRVDQYGQVTVGAQANGYAKLGVAKDAGVATAHVVTQDDLDAGKYHGVAVGANVQVVTTRIIVQSI